MADSEINPFGLDLKPCPFCGGRSFCKPHPLGEYIAGRVEWDCPAHSPTTLGETPEAAAEAWNTHAPIRPDAGTFAKVRASAWRSLIEKVSS